MRKEFVYSLAALSAIPVVANADAEAYKATAVQTVGTADVELEVGTLAKGKYTLTSDAISGANLTVRIMYMAGETPMELTSTTTTDGNGISLPFTVDQELTGVKIVLVHGATAITVPAPVITLKYNFALVANKLQIEHNKLTQALAGYEYPEKTTENAAAVAYYDRIMAIAAADYAFYKANTEGLQILSENQSNVNDLALYGEITATYAAAKNNEKGHQQTTLGGGNGLLGQYDLTYADLETGYLPVNYVTTDLTNAKTAAWAAYDTYIADVTNFDNRTAAKDAIAAYKTALDGVVTVKNDNEGAKTELIEALNAVYGATNSYYKQTIDAINTNYDGERYAALRTELTTALQAIVSGEDYTNVQTAIYTAYENKTAKADKNTIINQIAAFKQKITQKTSNFNALKDQLAAAYTTYDEQKASADELVVADIPDLAEEKQAVQDAVADLKTFIDGNNTEATIGNLTVEAIGNKVNAISNAKEAYSDKKTKYNKYTAVKTSVEAKQTALNNAVTAADTYAKDEKGLPQNLYKPSTSWATTIAAITTQINGLLGNVETNKWDAANYETSEAFTTAMAAITTATNDFVSRAKTATDLGATIYTQLNSAIAEKTATLAIEGIQQLNVWTNQVTTDEAIKARSPYNTVINTTIDGHITDWTHKLQTAVQKTGQYNPDPQAAGYTDNILGYLQDVLKSLGGDASKVLADDIATLKAIQGNWESDEQAFNDQVDQQQIAGMKTMINNKAAQFEPMIAALQARIDNGNEFGKIKGALLKTEIDAISQKINDAKAVAAKQDATKAEVTAAYNAIKNLDTTDIAVAQTNANTYAAAFTAFTNNYNTLNGSEDDTQFAGTVYGLKAKVKDQKDVIDAQPNLSADQKTALKAKVDAVEVVKEEGDPAVEVTYTIATINEFITEAWQNEQLTNDEVTKYQVIISDLKTATQTPVSQAINLNELEGNLADIDFNAAKTAILAKDPNPEGFFVVDKLLGNEKAGQCTFDFNALKGTIEADENITAGELNTYNGQISALNGTINGLPDLALTNLNAKNEALKAYSDDTPETIAEKGAVQRYEYYVATLKAERQTSALEDQLLTLATLKDALDQLKADAEAHYVAGTAGTASPTDKDNIDAKANEIKAKFDEYYNEVNYNAQVAADNLAQYNLIKDAKATVQGTYDVAASVINTYKNFKSTELKGAAEAAQTELQNLLDYLVGYDALVSGDKGIQTRADAAYNAVVSPEKFDGTPYIAEYQAVNEQITNLKKALTDKIEPLFKDAVSKSVNSYSEAITSSKAKVAKFSATDADLTEAQLNELYAAIDNKLKAINDVKDDADMLAELDAALTAAANATTGINASITNVEQDQAKTALVALRTAIPEPDDNLQGTDLDSYNALNTRINSNSASNKRYRVNNFSTMKAELQRLKAVAEKYAADQAAIAETTGAINTAAAAVNGLVADYGTFAAGFEVKADVEAVQAELTKYPVAEITAENAEAWKTAAEAIPGAVTEVYNKLFDKEDAAIKDLIKQAKEENLTYKYDGDDDNLKKEVLSAKITEEEGKLAAAETDVARDSEDAQYKTKKDALTDGTYANNLKAIEGKLNGYILTMTTGNGTNINQAILNNLNTTTNAQNNRLNSLYNSIYSATYKDVTNTTNYYSTAEVFGARTAIVNSIVAVHNYIANHQDEIAAYESNVEAMQADINKALDNFETLVNNEKEKQTLAFVAADEQAIADQWAVSENNIGDAEASIENMEKQLSLYGSADQYANKVGKLKDQVIAANAVLADAKTAAESLTKLRDKYLKANSTITDVNAELAGVDGNCADIIGMAKQAYIDAFIAGLNAQIIADTWSNSSNYTTTDKATLTNERNALLQSVVTLQANAEACTQAEDIKLEVAPWINKGVISTLNEGAENFTKDLDKLKQDLKDMSLVEDVKGHIVPDKEEIDTDDMEALADIILNGEEETADMNRCDINGDGDVDVTDLIWLRYFLVHGDWPNVPAASRSYGGGDINNLTMQATANGNITRIAVNLSNETVFNHFQLNIQLPEGAKVVGQTLGERVEGANLLVAQNGNMVRMLAVSSANNVFAGNDGVVVYFDIENLSGDIKVEKAIFTDTEFKGHNLMSGEATGITERITNAIETAGQKIYDFGGRVLRGLKKGVNIIRNSDGTTTKVLKK